MRRTPGWPGAIRRRTPCARRRLARAGTSAARPRRLLHTTTPSPPSRRAIVTSAPLLPRFCDAATRRQLALRVRTTPHHTARHRRAIARPLPDAARVPRRGSVAPGPGSRRRQAAGHPFSTAHRRLRRTSRLPLAPLPAATVITGPVHPWPPGAAGLHAAAGTRSTCSTHCTALQPRRRPTRPDSAHSSRSTRSNRHHSVTCPPSGPAHAPPVHV